MCNVVKKMSDHVPESFFRLHVLLPAYMAVIFPVLLSRSSGNPFPFVEGYETS
jgi:hypothetical protein